MQITRRRFWLASSSAGFLTQTKLSFGNKRERNARATTAGKEVSVYTTAENTDYRITATDKVSLKPLAQPLETQICVFVDPARTFQTHLGIGGAMTDAAAETFAKLPKDKQQEILTAYFDPVKGLGYTLARTNIHSCDFSSASYTYVTEGDKDL